MANLDPKSLKNILAEIVNKPSTKIVTVTGDGKVTALSDLAIFSFSVLTQAQTVKQVTMNNTQKMNAILKGMKKLKIKEKDIITSKYSLFPNYRHSKNRPPKITGYNLDKEIIIKTKKFELIDKIFEVITKEGVNKMMLLFDIGDTKAYKKQAREKAFEDARKKAEEMAEVAGVRLGKVVTFSENETEQYPTHSVPSTQIGFSTLGGELSGPVSVVESGSKEFTASVSVTYEIE
jgi:uncharacterized protein YggE